MSSFAQKQRAERIERRLTIFRFVLLIIFCLMAYSCSVLDGSIKPRPAISMKP